MGSIVTRSIKEPIRQGLSWQERWSGPDKGLITCWEVGRDLGEKKPEMAESSKKGALPVLGWKGGVSKKLVQDKLPGSLFYLAMWQGLRNEDLNIDVERELVLTCSLTGQMVIYSATLLEDEKEERFSLALKGGAG